MFLLFTVGLDIIVQRVYFCVMLIWLKQFIKFISVSNINEHVVNCYKLLYSIVFYLFNINVL